MKSVAVKGDKIYRLRKVAPIGLMGAPEWVCLGYFVSRKSAEKIQVQLIEEQHRRCGYWGEWGVPIDEIILQ